MFKVTIHTDGSAGTHGPGGFAAILSHPEGLEEELIGIDPSTNSQRAELQAAIMALEYLVTPHIVSLYTDSLYLCEGWHAGLQRWAKNGWRAYSGGQVKNMDLWLRLVAAGKGHVIAMAHVRGHTGDVMNERCDKLAWRARKDLILKLGWVRS